MDGWIIIKYEAFDICHRLAAPWPELETYAASIDLDALDDIHHKHVPYGMRRC